MFVRGARCEVDDFSGRFEFFAGARAEEVKLNFEGVKGGLIFERNDFATDAHAGARGIEMRLGARKQPFFELLDEFLFLLGLFDFREAFEVRVRHQFGRERTIVAEEKKSGFFETFLAARIHQTRPPGLSRKIFAGERELFEIIFEQQPGALRIGATREEIEEIGAFGDGLFSIRKFAAQIGEGAISFV